MKVYRVSFRSPEKQHSPVKYFVWLKDKANRLNLNPTDKTVLLLENDLKKYWDYGGTGDTYTDNFIGGVEKVEYIGDLDNLLFKPVLSEPDFVNTQIQSKKNNEVIGYQG